ncbi:MAG TPA: cyclic nucleotide-binding domain-containing protein [Fibrobacteria bacterium]|nr:cyclic nucleotide-binding domain-containing protein [Fibrobacteria bacterium]
MDEAEKSWALKASELHNCPFYTKGDSLQVQMPGVFGNQLTMCSMPVATFIPVAMDGRKPEGYIEAGYKNCSCRWSYCQMSKLSKPAMQFEEVLTAENQMARPFLEQMPVTVARAFRERASALRFRSGDVILQANTTSSHFHVIVKGMVRIASRGGDGRVLELSVLRKGDCFGEMSILTGAATSNQVDAVEECLTLAIAREDFHKLVAEYPVLSIILYRMLSKRIKATNQKLAQLLSPGLSGDLRFFAFTDLVQTVMTARMTGTLVVEQAQRRARFGFREGGLIHGSLGNMNGTQAVDEALRWGTGSFRFNPDQVPPEANLDGDTMAILLEALRRMDESSVLEKTADGLIVPP